MNLIRFYLLFVYILLNQICIGQEIRITFVGNLNQSLVKELSQLENKFRDRKISVRNIYGGDEEFYEFEKDKFSAWNSQNSRFNDFEKTLEHFSTLINRKTKILVWPSKFKTDDLSRLTEDLLRDQIKLNRRNEIPLSKEFFKEVKNTLKSRNDVEILYLIDTLEYEFSCLKLSDRSRDKEIRWDKQVEIGVETFYMLSSNGARFYKMDFNAPLLPLDYRLKFQCEDNSGAVIQFSREISSSTSITYSSLNQQDFIFDSDTKIILNQSTNKISVYVSLANLIELLGSQLKKKNIDPNSIIHSVIWVVKLESFKENCKSIPVRTSNTHQINLSCTDPD